MIQKVWGVLCFYTDIIICFYQKQDVLSFVAILNPKCLYKSKKSDKIDLNSFKLYRRMFTVLKKGIIAILILAAVILSVFSVLTKLGIIEIRNEGNVDEKIFETTFSVNDFEKAIDIQYMSDYMLNSEDMDIEREMMNYLNANYEWLGTTKTKFKMDGYDFEEFYVYQCVYLDKPTLFCLIPIVDGRAQPLGFQYNQDNSLTLIWSR